LLTLILSIGVCHADSYVGGIPLTSVQSGTVDGGVYLDSYYGMDGQSSKVPLSIDKTFTLPADAEVEWAMLLTTVYCGNMQNNYQGTANVIFNGKTLGNETLNVPFAYINDGGAGYVQVNDHVDRVTSDYMMYYDVTDLVKAGENTAIVNTAPLDSYFDGRIKLISLVVAYNNGSGKKIWYHVNRGHDVVSYNDDYVGSTGFQAALPEGASLTDAALTVVHMASTDGVYTFNGNALTSGTPQGTYCGSDSWDVKDFFKSSGTNALTYNRDVESEVAFYKCALGILTAEYTESAAEKSDLTISGAVNTVPSSAVFAKEANSVKVTNILNNGTSTLTNISVALYASDVSSGEIPVNTTNIASLEGGGSTTVTLIDPTIRSLEGGTVTYTAVVDPDNLISETNETNNNKKSSTKSVKYNGYKGKRYWEGGSDVTTRQTFDLKGDLIYFTQPLSAYKSLGWTGRTETWNENDLPVPDGSTVEKALLYVPYNWDTTPGGVPNWTATFNDIPLTDGTLYTDKSNFGGYANNIYGLYVFDVTAQFKTGSNSLIMKSGTGNSNALYPSTLVVIYSDPSETRKQIFINEECDELGYSELILGTTLEEATAYVPFTGMTIDVGALQKAVLYSFAGSAGPDEGNLLFNGNTIATNAWNGDSGSSSAQVFDVTGYLKETGNEASIQGTTEGGMAAFQQILVIEYPADAPVAAFTATPTSGDAPLTVSFTDESTGTPASWAWDLGDGSSSSEQNVSHTYTSAGSYTVTLTVSSAEGSDSEVKERYITVSEPLPSAPVANFTANVTSGEAPLDVQFFDASTGTVSSYSWDFDNDGSIDSTEQNPLHTYADAGTYSVKLTVTSAGGSDEELRTGYITVTAPPVSEPDLFVSAITPNAGEIFANEANTISAKVENSGTADAGSFTVNFDVNGIHTNVTVDSLSAGANATLSITDPAIRAYGESVEVTVTADSENSVSESDESNNSLPLTKTVVYNGYKGKRWTDGEDINTREAFEGKFDVIYSHGNSAYASTKWLIVSDTWTSSDLPIPADATVVSAWLYQPYSYNKMGVDPAFTAVFNGVTISTDAAYKDTKGYDGYNYPYGLYVYNVTGQFSPAGNTLTLTPEGTPGTTNDYSLWGAYLVVVYSDPATREKQIIINDGFDMLYSRSSYSVTSEEATACADFFVADADNIENAEVIAILASAGDSGKSKFFFNGEEYTGFWADYLATPQIGFSTYNVTDKLASGSSEARFQSYDSGSGGDNMYAMNAILVLEYTEAAPVAGFTADTTSGTAPLTVNFTDESAGTLTSWAWDFENDGVVDSTEQNPSHTYPSAGTYTVNLTVIGPGGSDSEVKERYIVASEQLPEAPVANFTANVTSGTVPMTVQFTDTSTGSPTSWQWDFNNDGETDSTEQTAIYTYTTAGTYTVKLIVANDGGSDDEVKTEYIVVSEPLPAPPVTAFTANPTSGDAPLAVQFTDESTGSPTSWSWDFNNDGTVDSSEQNPSYTYTSAGNYTVNLTVANAGGSTSELKTDYITVSEPFTPTAPVAAFTADVTSGIAPLNVNFTDQSTGTPTSWLWDFGDGMNSTEQNPERVYSAAGDYTVTLTVSNEAGSDTVTKESYIKVGETSINLAAEFSASPTSGNAPLEVSFTDESTGSPTSWKWDFGDGKYSRKQNPVHTFSKAGNYTVSLTVRNADGRNKTIKSDYITVSSSLPVADFSASPVAGTAPLEVSFTDTSTGSPTSWKWDFGDGKSSRKQNPVHTFSKAGNYTVSLTVRNADGSNTTTMSDYITVSSSLPVASFSSSPASGNAPLEVKFTDQSTGSPTSWKWNFGDGTYSTASNPVHTYKKAGTYSVSLKVKNKEGSSTKTTSTIVVHKNK
jgi:PKD repeat protein